MDNSDDYALKKISKRYSNASTKHWEKPSTELISAVEKVLQINKARALEPLSRSKRLNNTNAQISAFINEFLVRLERAKLPKNLDSRDFDYDYQLQREVFLQKLCSNELKMVENLEDALEDEEDELKSLEKYVSTYERLYKEELKKLEELDGDDVVKKVKRHERNEVRSIDLELDDDELNQILQELESHLDRLGDRFEPLQNLSTKLDNFIGSLP